MPRLSLSLIITLTCGFSAVAFISFAIFYKVPVPLVGMQDQSETSVAGAIANGFYAWLFYGFLFIVNLGAFVVNYGLCKLLLKSLPFNKLNLLTVYIMPIAVISFTWVGLVVFLDKIIGPW